MSWETNSRHAFSLCPAVVVQAPITIESIHRTPQDRDVERLDLLASAASRDLPNISLSADVMDLHRRYEAIM